MSDTAELNPDMICARAGSHLREADRRYPWAWRHFDFYRAHRAELGDWPGWCFCPLLISQSIVNNSSGKPAFVPVRDDPSRPGLSALPTMLGIDPSSPHGRPEDDTIRMAVLGAWRPSQRIYAIDPTILEAVLATPIAGNIPVDVLMCLPQWSIYVPTPGWVSPLLLARDGTMVPAAEVAGFFACLVRHQDPDIVAGLVLLLDYRDGTPWDGLKDTVLHLYRDVPVDRCLAKTWTRVRNTAIRIGRMGWWATTDFMADPDGIFRAAAAALEPLLSVLLYLCSKTAEYRAEGATGHSRPANPEPAKTTKGWRLFPPQRPTIYRIGERLGQAIRDGEARAEALRAEANARGDRKPIGPHTRKAHWHGYWHGPKAGPREFILHWLPPIPVAMAEDDGPPLGNGAAPVAPPPPAPPQAPAHERDHDQAHLHHAGPRGRRQLRRRRHR